MEFITDRVLLFLGIAWLCMTPCLSENPQNSEVVYSVGSRDHELPHSRDASFLWLPMLLRASTYPLVQIFGRGNANDEQVDLLLPSQRLVSSTSPSPSPSLPATAPPTAVPTSPPLPSPAPISPSPSSTPPPTSPIPIPPPSPSISPAPTFPPSSTSPSPTPYPFSPPPSSPSPSVIPPSAPFPSFPPSPTPSISPPSASPVPSPSVSPPIFPPSPIVPPPILPPSSSPSPIVPPPITPPSSSPSPIVPPPIFPPSPTPSPVVPPPIFPPSPSTSPSISPPIFPPSLPPTPSPISPPILPPSPSPSIFPPSQSPSLSPTPFPGSTPTPSPSPTPTPPQPSPTPSPTPSPSPPAPSPEPVPPQISVLANLTILNRGKLEPDFDPFVFNYTASFGSKAPSFQIIAYLPLDEDYKYRSLHIESTPLIPGEKSPALVLGKRGETVTYHIFVRAINHERSTYVISATRGAGHKGLGPVVIFLVVLACIVGVFILLVLSYAVYVYARTGRMLQPSDFRFSRQRDGLYSPLIAQGASEGASKL